MLVKDFMIKDFPTLFLHHTLQDALLHFANIQTNIIPIIDEQRTLIGVLTKNKLIQALADGLPTSFILESLITREPIYIAQEDSISQTRQLLLEHQIGHAPVLNQQMEPIGILSTTQILYGYEKVFDQMESRLSLLFNNLNFGLFSVDRHMNINAINPLADEILSNSSGGTIANADILDLLTGILSNHEPVMKRKVQINGYSLFIHSYPLIERNQLVGAMVIMDDITQLESVAQELQFSKEWETKLRSVIELAYDGFILVNQQAETTMVNDGFCELFNIHEKDVLGQPIINTYPELGIQDVLKTGVKLNNVAKLIGKTQCLITILPIKDKTEVVGAICKVTYRGLKHLQDALNKVTKLEKQVTYYQQELHDMRGTKYSFADIIGDSAAIQHVKKEALAASRSLSTVLIVGESGTGKELFAHGIHAASSQPGLFVQVNCAAIPTELLESEFFGYADGAFTGAKKGGKKGKFEMAQNGTLFLDEIGDMPMPLQTKLLRVLQEKEFEPLGSNRLITLNTKIIAATNQNLEALIKEGKFREDLYYRLNIMRLNIPPLRKRIEDIPDIIDAILARLNQSGFYLKGVTHAALTTLLHYSWPGNIRELQNNLERAANLTQDGYIDIQHLSTPFNQQNTATRDIPHLPQPTTEITSAQNIATNNYREAIDHKEKSLILAALKEANGNKAQASRILGISRPWLYAKLKKYQIED
ncbi:sigma 54-interacting transcriptional regulator [Sporosarcina sp. FSL K6-1522]|uniref:sigma 54-interacting transcriptional regulator n=1 Tax=Sporosarcina sp. FSL K6-1522 TaxID=2921554 RepID=UPI00315A88FC